jgi:hypothetical protein
MTSSGGGGDDGMAMMALRGGGTPMPGLPIAGQGGGGVGYPYKYGQFQNFLPDIKAEGPNDMATGLRPEMFDYKKPGGGAVAAGGGGNTDGQVQDLRDQLARLSGGGGGGIGTMGMGRGGFGSAMNGVAPPADAQQLPTPPGGWARGNVPGWPVGGPDTNAPGFANDWRTKDAAPLIKGPGG